MDSKIWKKESLKKDLFIGYLMEMKYISESGSTDVGGAKKKNSCARLLIICASTTMKFCQRSSVAFLKMS